MTDRELQSLISMGVLPEKAADEIVRLRVRVAELEAAHEDASGAILHAVEAERERCEDRATAYARAWWQQHCASNRHMEIRRQAHEDFAALAREIRAGATR